MASPPSDLFVSPGPGGADFRDDISLTSTDYGIGEEDEGKEWIVEDLYAERPHPERPGEKQYLIKWEGFPMDECTWEPIEHLGPGLLAQWEETKEYIAAGKREAFDVEIYNVAITAKLERRARRNAERKRRELSLTYPFSPEPPVQEPTSVVAPDEMDIDDGAQGTSDGDQGRQTSTTLPLAQTQEPPQEQPQEQARDIIKQKTSHEIPPEKPKAEASSAQKPIKKPTVTPTSTVPPKPAQKPAQKPSGPRRTVSDGGVGKGTMTGYQGTARKPSTGAGSIPSRISSTKPPNQKASGSLPRNPPTVPPRMSSSLANKFSGKRHTATRTRPQPAAQATPPVRTNNVFIGGKERKKRASLGDVMGDPSKAPKAFNSMRVMNIAKKRGIERNEAAHLDISSIPSSFFVTNSPKTRYNTEQNKVNSPSTPPALPHIVQSPTAISPTDAGATSSALRTKKSVRFSEAEDNALEDTPMTDAMDVAAPGGRRNSMDGYSQGPKSGNGPPLSRRLSLSTYQERGQNQPTQVVSKRATFGKPESDPVRVLFSGITRQAQPWLTSFIAQETLNFGSVCASYNFIPHQGLLVGEILSAGAIEPHVKETMPTLGNVAEHLRRSSYGCHLVTNQFSILVYPADCDSWEKLEVGVNKPDSASPLRYVIYRSRCDVKLYPPACVPRAPARLNDAEQRSRCKELIKELFDLDFSQFLPQEPNQKNKQVFMLLFPEREMQVCNVVKLWLRSCQPNCRIFSNEITDSWTKFHETVRAGAAGTIIIHEDVSTIIRKLPRVSQMIENKRCYTFWNLATGLYDPPRFPSDVYATIEPGTLQLTRLFPHGRAFLITPSFALSDPVRLYQFLDWFKNYCCNPHYLIMACADFPDYLKAITLEKAKESEAMREAEKDNPRLEDKLADYGLSKADLEARFQAWKTLQEILEEFGDEETSEDVRKVEWITDFIDPNDEQSLVNWFCFWSTMKCDRYRKFTVLGSSNGRNRAAYRRVQIPAYTDETVGNPDIAMAREDEQRRAREADRAAEVAKELGKDAVTVQAPTNIGPNPATPASHLPTGPRGGVFHSSIAVDIRRRITSLYSVIPKSNWARLHFKPISWLDVKMADHFKDERVEYETYNNWFKSIPKFSRANTRYGLFYTIDKEWDPAAHPSTYGCHPWIAVVRPVNPHFQSRYAEMELFIWDMSARDRERARGRAAILLDMQRRLIRLVKEELPKLDPQYFLGPVYISSEKGFVPRPDESPLDLTFRRVHEMIIDGKNWLPAFEHLLPELGWHIIPDSEWQGDISSSEPSLETQGPEFPKHPSDEGKFRRSIWHAPRPRAKVGKSKCGNHLYQTAFSARKKDPSCQAMRYQYKSTPEWYYDMKTEGRDASHVVVDCAEKILPKLIQKKTGNGGKPGDRRQSP